jgi:uncharacterized protein (DUF1778 family)/GNAT superfamily N-acetyltransferase
VAIIREAASQTERTVTDFVMESAVEEAERILADASHFSLTEVDWSVFNEILERAPVVKPRLAALMSGSEDGIAPR